MTMPRERQLAIKNTRNLLLDLMDPKKTPRVPHVIRKEASQCLKHYPSEYDMSEAAESLDRQNKRQRVWKEHSLTNWDNY